MSVLRLISWLFGKVMRVSWPGPINQIFLKAFVGLFAIDVTQAELDLSEYRSVADFFVRSLKPGLRPVQGNFVSPVDGNCRTLGSVQSGLIEQIKGSNLTIEDLLQIPEAQKFIDGYYINLYLAPSDYHHIHSPVAGKIVKTVAVPGTLWPVNAPALRNVRSVFCKNERIITLIHSEFGLIALVMVGAMNVGQISLEYDEMRTNLKPLCSKGSIIIKEHSEPIDIAAGQRLGTFHMGSTVVLLLEKRDWNILINAGDKVKYGQRLL